MRIIHKLQVETHVENERVEIYHLRTPLEVWSEFQLLLPFITWLHNKRYNDFVIMFNCTTANELKNGFRHREGTSFNMNMFIEAFYRLLKIVYLDNKHNRRIDPLLNTLLRIARDKAYERFIKLEIGKCSHRICEISKWHKAAECLLEEINYRLPTPVIPDMKGSVYSSNLIDSYIVLKQKGSCECKLYCI